MSSVSRGLRILSDEGPVSFARESSKYVGYKIYFAFRDQHRLSIDDVSISLSVPNYSVFKRNEYRFTSEQAILTDLLRELDSDDVFYDIGANTGLYSLFASKKCSQVFAFEPYPPNVNTLKRDVPRNDASNIELYETALSDSNDTKAFSQPDEKDIGYGSSSIVAEETKHSLEVPTKTGDDVIRENGLPTPTVIKIDVEGSEPLVIDGLEQSLSSPDCELLYCEVHLGEVDKHPSIYDFDTDLTDIKSQLRGYGFSIEEMEKRTGETFLKAYK